MDGLWSSGEDVSWGSDAGLASVFQDPGLASDGVKSF